jgi:hypothetical protein
MTKNVERVIETLSNQDGTIIFRRSDGTSIWRSSDSKHLSLLLKYTYSPVVTPPPNAGQVRTDGDTIVATTLMWIHRQDSDNRDNKFFFTELKSGQQLYVQEVSNSDNRAVLTLTEDAVDSGSYVTCKVVCDNSNGLPLSGKSILIGILV